MTPKLKYLLFISLLYGCTVDPNREYSAGLKHEAPALEYMPDMYRSPSYKANSDNPNFPDQMTSLSPVKGTIPRDYYDIRFKNKSGIDTTVIFTFHYPATNPGYDSAGQFVQNPVPGSEEAVASGKIKYDNFCSPCHGAEGKGDGILVQNGKFPPPPAYSTGISSRGGNTRDLTPGKIYHTITYGVNLMGSHASQLSPDERWRIVHYVQQLQKTGAPADTLSKKSNL